MICRPITGGPEQPAAVELRDAFLGRQIQAVTYRVLPESGETRIRGRVGTAVHSDIQEIAFLLDRGRAIVTWAIEMAGPRRGVEGLTLIEDFVGVGNAEVDGNRGAWERFVGRQVEHVRMAWTLNDSTLPEGLWAFSLDFDGDSLTVALGTLAQDCSPVFAADELLVLFDGLVTESYLSPSSAVWRS